MHEGLHRSSGSLSRLSCCGTDDGVAPIAGLGGLRRVARPATIICADCARSGSVAPNDPGNSSTDANLTHLLCVQEVQMGSKLGQLVVADRERADEVLQRGRKRSKEFKAELKKREKQTLVEQAEELEKAQELAAQAAEEKQELRLAREDQ